MLTEYFEYKDKFGHLKIFVNEESSVFVVSPSGIVNPSLIKLNLIQVRLMNLEKIILKSLNILLIQVMFFFLIL